MNKLRIAGSSVNLDAFASRRELEQSDVFAYLGAAERKAAIDRWCEAKGWKHTKPAPVIDTPEDTNTEKAPE
jgi:hypothetical protein